METVQSSHKKTKLGKFLQNKAPKLLKSILGIAGNLIPGGKTVTNLISNMIEDDTTLSPQDKEQALKFLQIDLQNTINARAMQEAALLQTDLFSKRFVYYFALFWSVISASYIFSVTFFDVVNPRISDTVMGFMLGTIISTIVNFFYGSSQGSKDKTNPLK